jgi:serine/threonine-protein kinase
MGMVYGTPEYMAPEQALGQPVDARADLYALGVMSYEMLTGVRPFEHESKVALLGMHVTAPVPAMAQKSPDANVPIEVEQIILKLLAKESTERTQDARDLIENINQVVARLAAEGRIDSRFAGALAGAPLSQVRAQASSSSSEVSSPLSLGRSADQLPATSLSRGAAYRDSPGLTRANTPANGTRDAAAGPPIIMTPRPLLSNVDKQRLIPVLGVAAGFGALLIILALVISRGKTTTAPADGAVAVASNASATTTATEIPQTPPGDAVKEGLALVDKGDFSAGADKLEALSGADRERLDVRRALVRAYSGKRAYKEAMREATALLAGDPKLASDIPLATTIRDAALSSDKDAADEAFTLLESTMGEFGIDILYEMAFSYTGQYPAQAKRAQKVLNKPEVHARASASTQVNIDIRASATAPCNIKPMLERAKENGDVQTLALLKPLAGYKRCGFAGTRTCALYPCLVADGQLKETIATLEMRTAKKH